MNSKVRWLFFDFSNWDHKTLELHYRELGGSTEEATQRGISSFLAGRIALYALLKQEDLDYSISAQKAFGFLQMMDSKNRLVENCFPSVSHTEKVAVAALSDSPVGIDVELRNRSPIKGVLKIASQKELASVKNLSNEFLNQVSDPLLYLWTGKEAVSKALGLGLRKEIHDFELCFEGSPPFSIYGQVKSPLSLQRPVVSFFFEKDYLVSICAEKNTEIVKLPLLLEGVAN